MLFWNSLAFSMIQRSCFFGMVARKTSFFIRLLLKSFCRLWSAISLQCILVSFYLSCLLYIGFLYWYFWIYVSHQFWKFLGLYPLKKILAHFKFLLLGGSLQAVWYYPIGLKEKAMATHSGTLAWKIPWAEEPGRLQSMGSRRVRTWGATSLSLFTFMH